MVLQTASSTCRYSTSSRPSLTVCTWITWPHSLDTRFHAGASGANSIDYDALGGVMRDNVSAGGNVYLDGRTVGRVISASQANSFRNLERSGWQG